MTETRAAISRLALAALLFVSGCAQSGVREPDRAAYNRALEDRSEFRAQLESSCERLESIDRVIQEAILIGAPVYNVGSALGCFRIYEGSTARTVEARWPARQMQWHCARPIGWLSWP